MQRTTLKFNEMPYTRPNPNEIKKALSDLTARLKNASTYEEAKAVFEEKDRCGREVNTMEQLAQIRHSIDTRDAFYDEEMKFWSAAGPELQEYEQAFTTALMASVS